MALIARFLPWLLPALLCAGGAAAAIPGEGPPPAGELPGAGPYDEALRERLAQALESRGPEYRPRTGHINDEGSPRYTNRLILETSPYLLQHAHNPVDWYPWGDEAFDRARELDRPVILSIGYSTCHWCHVMERESFEDIEIARFMNENFIAIKVDREERPDLDAVYMAALHTMGLNGGWPMTTVLTPDRRPFFGGTYFPPRAGDRGAARGFWEILHELRDRYRRDREGVVRSAAAISQRIAAGLSGGRPGEIPGPEAIVATARTLAATFDTIHGGFGAGQKFPRPVALTLLLRYHRRTGDPQALKMVTWTLERMARGGIHDQVGGGFHRYTVERTWLIPHFEKMLYDNAQLAMIYLEAWQATGRAEFAEVARRTLDYVAREMTAPGGGFFSATDADSPSPSGHAEEGLFFTWTVDEVVGLLGEEVAGLVIEHYGMTRQGNFEGRNVLRLAVPVEQLAAARSIEVSKVEARVVRARQRLYEERGRRPPPLTDTKIVTAWNGLMISAFARGALVLGDESYRRRAEEAARFLFGNCHKDGRLFRTWAGGRRGSPGVLDDYAFLAAAALDLYEATFDTVWIDRALSLHRTLEERFQDAARGGFFTTPDDGEKLLAREKGSYDGAEPSGNSVALLNLLRLHDLTGEEKHRTMAERGLAAFSPALISPDAGAPLMLGALDYYLDRSKEIVLIASRSEEEVRPFVGKLADRFLPNRVVAAAVEGKPLERLASVAPLAANRTAVDGAATAYVCENRVCKLPTTDPEVFAKQIAETAPYEGISPEPLKFPAPPEPWSYDAAGDRHWHPGHGHWHEGQPPPPDKRD